MNHTTLMWLILTIVLVLALVALVVVIEGKKKNWWRKPTPANAPLRSRR